MTDLPDTTLFTWVPQLVAQHRLPEGFQGFYHAGYELLGLARIDGSALTLLALMPLGTGERIADFLAEATRLYAHVAVYDLLHPVTENHLLAADFVGASSLERIDGARRTGHVWTREHAAQLRRWRERTVIGPYRRPTPAEIEAQQQALATALAMQRQHALQRAA